MDTQVDALIGSYDDDPKSPDFISQYRNLMHCSVHQTGRSEASTFWSGCGAIRREVFLESGGFDETYVRPAIEDIELGYRLTRSLVCANAEALPFAEGCFDLVTAHDLIEHVRHPGQAVSEASRVSRSGARALWATNNRYAPLPEPHVRFWGVGCLPRRWQPRYVAWRRKDLPPYAIRMRSASELKRLFQRSEYSKVCIGPAPLVAPHWKNSLLAKLLDLYNQLRNVLFIGALARLVGPRLWVRTWR